MRAKPRTGKRSGNGNNRSPSLKKFQPYVIPLEDSPPSNSSFSRALRSHGPISTKYVSPLGNVSPKITEQIIARKKKDLELDMHDRFLEDAKTKTRSAKRSRRLNRLKMTRGIQKVNGEHSKVEVVVISDASQSRPIRHDGKEQPLIGSIPLTSPSPSPVFAVVTECEALPVPNLTTEIERPNQSSSTTKLSDKYGVQNLVSSGENMCNLSSNESVTEASDELLLKKDKGNVQQNAKDVNCSRSVVCIDDDDDDHANFMPTGSTMLQTIQPIKSQSKVDSIVDVEAPQSDPIGSDGEKQPSSVDAPLLSPALTAEVGRLIVNDCDHVKDMSQNEATAELSDKCGVQKQNTCNLSSDKSVTEEKDKETVQQNAEDLNDSSQSVLGIDLNHSNSMPTCYIDIVGRTNVTSKNGLNSLQAKRSKRRNKGTKRKRKEYEACDDLKIARKKRRNASVIDVESTANVLTQDINKETINLINYSRSSCSSKAHTGDELETIDLALEPDIVLDTNSSSTLNNTIELSDGEESVNNDIIVLGSPVIPSVRSYKAIKKCVGTRSVAVPSLYRPSPLPTPGVDFSQNIIARAISQLSKTMDGSQLRSNVASQNLKFGVQSNKDLSSMTASTSSTLPSPNSIYGSNIYNPGGEVVKTGLRPVIIDGSNVAMGHGENGKFFSSKGIDICVNYFVKKGHKVFAFVPKFRRGHYKTRDSYLLDKLESEKNLVFTPSRYVDGQSDVPYDDRYIVQTAAELGGVIVSTDNYKDLMSENSQWHDTIKNRLLMFTWVEDLLIFPQDPLGRRGGTLEQFLRF